MALGMVHRARAEKAKPAVGGAYYLDPEEGKLAVEK